MLKKTVFLFLCVSAASGMMLFSSGCGERDPQKLLSAAAAAEKENRTADALSLAERSVRHNPDDVDSLLVCAALLEKSGDPAKALPLAEKASKLAPERFEAHHLEGKILMRLPGRHTEAVAPLLRAKNLAPADPDNLLLLAAVHAETGNYTELLKCLRSLSGSPRVAKCAAYHNLSGVYYFHYKLYEKALQNFLSAYRFDRKSPRIVYNMARCQEARGNAAGARQFYQLYLKLAENKSDSDGTVMEVRAKLAKLK